MTTILQLDMRKATGVLSPSSDITSGGSRWHDLLPVCRDNFSRSSFRFHHDGAGNIEGGDEPRSFANEAAAGLRASHQRSRRYDDVDFERRGRCDRRCRRPRPRPRSLPFAFPGVSAVSS